MARVKNKDEFEVWSGTDFSLTWKDDMHINSFDGVFVEGYGDVAEGQTIPIAYSDAPDDVHCTATRMKNTLIRIYTPGRTHDVTEEDKAMLVAWGARIDARIKENEKDIALMRKHLQGLATKQWTAEDRWWDREEVRNEWARQEQRELEYRREREEELAA